MADTKTKPTAASVEDFLSAVEPAPRREDARAICALMQRLSGEAPRLWGGTMVGFGSYHYRYASGREGNAFRIGFSPRKGALVLYIMDGFPGHAALLDRLGRHTTGKSCLYLKKLADVDLGVLEELVAASLRHMRELYPEG